METVDCQPGPHQIARYTNCPLRTVLEVLANKWTLVVMVTLRRREDPIRFNELQRTLDGAGVGSFPAQFHRLFQQILTDHKICAFHVY